MFIAISTTSLKRPSLVFLTITQVRVQTLLFQVANFVSFMTKEIMLYVAA
jgi:hypothetical protein